MAELTIRPAVAADADAVATLWNPIIRDTLVTFTHAETSAAAVAETVAGKTAAGRPFLLAEHGETLAGFATYGPFRAGPGYADTMEHTIVLAPAARGRGTGRRLMAALEGRARAEGVHSLIAGISAANAGAVAFHTALGFAHVARLPEVGCKFGRRLDLVLMQKMLAARPDFATIPG